MNTTKAPPFPEHIASALAFGMSNPRPHKQMLFAVFCLLGLAASDIILMWMVQHDRFTDPVNAATLTVPIYVVAIACAATLFLYLLIGHLFAIGGKARLGSYAVYAGLLAFIAAAMYPAYSSMYEGLWSYGANAGWSQANSGAPQWFLWIWVVLQSLIFSVPGLLFIKQKFRFAALQEQYANHDEIASIRKHVDRLADLHREAQAAAALVAHFERAPGDDFEGIWASLAGQMTETQDRQIAMQEAVATSVRSSESAKRNARTASDRLKRSKASLRDLMVVALGVGLAATAAAPRRAAAMTVDEQLRTAPALVVLIDASPSVTSDADFMAAAAPQVESRLRAMPLGSGLVVSTVGDASLAPLVFRSRLQAKIDASGMPVDLLARRVKSLLYGFPATIKDRVNQRSELIGGMSDAARWINPQATDPAHPNEVVYLTDGIENSNYARLWQTPDFRLPRNFHFPPPAYRLPNTRVTMLGIGQGLASDRAAALMQLWREQLAKAGVPSPLLLRE